MENNEEYTLDDLFDAWQRQSDRVNQVAGEHPVSEAVWNPHSRYCPQERRLLILVTLRFAVSLGALVWLVFFSRHYVNDMMDLVPHLLIGLILLYVIISSLPMMAFLIRHPVSSASPIEMARIAGQSSGRPDAQEMHQHPMEYIPKQSFVSFTLRSNSNVITLAALMAILLVVVTPSYEGQSMSVRNKSKRIETLALANHITDLITRPQEQ